MSDIDDLDDIVNGTINDEISELEQKIKDASQKYHTNGSSGISDLTWDLWVDRLTELDPNNPLLEEVGNGYEIEEEVLEGEGLVKVEHPIIVGSITKCKDPNLIKSKIGKNSTFSVKLDGNSVVAYYRYGVLENVITRGKNNIGIDRTNKFKFIIPNTIGIKLPYIAVRGEAVIAKDNYTIENGFDISNSSRNTVAGLIAKKDNWEPQFKHIEFVAYTFIDINTKKDIYSNYKWSDYFTVEEQKPCKIFMDMKLDDFFYDYKANWKYDADGTVFKFDNGSMLALKYRDETITTLLKAIQWAIGIDQRLTPVAFLEPVKLSGATISKASLGSYDRYKSLGINSNHLPYVEIIRANEIIPYVTKVVSHSTYLMNEPILPKCPCCGSEAVIEGKHAYCKNPACPNIESAMLYKFSSFFYPDGLSDKQISKIYDAYKIKTILDLLKFNHSRVDLKKISGVGSSLALLIEIFFNNLNNKIDSKIVYQSVIMSCGRTISKTIVNSGIKISDIYSNNDWVTILQKLPGFNSKVITQMLEKKDLIEAICKLRTVEDIVPKKVMGTYCITGMRFNKSQVDMLSIEGWIEDSSVKKTTTVLVTNDIYGTSTKIDKAKKYNIPIVDPEKFFEDYITERSAGLEKGSLPLKEEEQ